MSATAAEDYMPHSSEEAELMCIEKVELAQAALRLLVVCSDRAGYGNLLMNKIEDARKLLESARRDMRRES